MGFACPIARIVSSLSWLHPQCPSKRTWFNVLLIFAILSITKTTDSSEKQSQSNMTRTKIDRKTEEGTRFGCLWDPYSSLCVKLAIPTHESLITSHKPLINDGLRMSICRNRVEFEWVLPLMGAPTHEPLIIVSCFAHESFAFLPRGLVMRPRKK